MKLKFYRENEKRDRTMRYIRYSIMALLFSVIHVVFLHFISVGGITPDFLLILVVWITLIEGPFAGLFAGFIIGILFDIVSSDVIGTNALAKTIGAFVAGWFYRDGSTKHKIGGFRLLLVVFIASMMHNLIYFFFYIKVSELDYFSFFLVYGLAISLYTTVFAIFAMVFKTIRSTD